MYERNLTLASERKNAGEAWTSVCDFLPFILYLNFVSKMSGTVAASDKIGHSLGSLMTEKKWALRTQSGGRQKFPLFGKASCKGMPKKQWVEDTWQLFQSQPNPLFRSGTSEENWCITNGGGDAFRLWGVILECGAPGLPFPGEIWSTSGPVTGLESFSPITSAQKKESKMQYWLLCHESSNMPWHSRTALPNTSISSPQDIQDMWKGWEVAHSYRISRPTRG